MAQTFPSGVDGIGNRKDSDERMQNNDRRWTLRARTAEAHHALDVLIGEFDTDASYRRYLMGMAAFRMAVEPSLSGVSFPAGYQPTAVAAETLADLADLGLPAPPPARFQPGLSFDAALGVLYVLEGSVLGAQLLVKRAAALGFDANCGARHLARQVASLDGWRDYLKLLDAAEPLDMEACAAAALATFDAALDAFEVGADA